MTAQIIPFPGPNRPHPPESAFVHLTWTGIELGENECTDVVHYFTARDECCQCGKEYWPKPIK